MYQVRLLGLDIFRPHDLATDAIAADNLPCWMLDTDYKGMVCMVHQVFFPKISAWDSLERSLPGRFAEGGLGPPGRHRERALRGGSEAPGGDRSHRRAGR